MMLIDLHVCSREEGVVVAFINCEPGLTLLSNIDVILSDL